jgi:hypothetical protein
MCSPGQYTELDPGIYHNHTIAKKVCNQMYGVRLNPNRDHEPDSNDLFHQKQDDHDDRYHT